MDISVYGEDRSALVRFDPRTKFVVFISSLAVSANSFNATAHEIYCVVLCVMLFLCGKKWNAVKMSLLLGTAVYVRTCMEMQATGSTVVVTIISFILTIFLYCFPILMSLLIITQTTRINQFLSAFQAMHIPTRIVIPIAVMFRFIPTVGEEWTGVRKAMAFRGMSLEPSAIIRHPVKTVEYILIPLLFSCISIMEELAAAALARGMDSDNARTSYETVHLRAYDYITMILFIAAGIWFFATGMVTGGAA